MINESKIKYLLSAHFLKELRDNDFISDEEYELIDIENRKSFHVEEN